MSMKRIVASAAQMIGLAVALVAGCGGAAKEPDGSSAKTDNAKAGGTYAPNINQSDFVEKIDNKYFPLEPGTTLVYEGKTEVGTERVELSAQW